jgi:hypothetical protein
MKKTLIDTSAWVEYFKGNRAVANFIHSREEYSVYIIGPVISELIQGMKTENEKESFTYALESINRIQIADQDWLDAGLAGSHLRSKGITVPFIDLIIYSAARNNQCSICTLDKHFQVINKNLKNKVEILEF